MVAKKEGKSSWIQNIATALNNQREAFRAVTAEDQDGSVPFVAIGPLGPEGSISAYVREHVEVARALGFDGEAPVESDWAVLTAHDLWAAHVEEALAEEAIQDALNERGVPLDEEQYTLLFAEYDWVLAFDTENDVLIRIQAQSGEEDETIADEETLPEEDAAFFDEQVEETDEQTDTADESYTHLTDEQMQAADEHFINLQFTPRESRAIRGLSIQEFLEYIPRGTQEDDLWLEKADRLKGLPHSGWRFRKGEFSKQYQLADFIRTVRPSLANEEQTMSVMEFLGTIPSVTEAPAPETEPPEGAQGLDHAAPLSESAYPFSPGADYFVRGDMEYRLVPETVGMYEFNRIALTAGTDVGPSFKRGGLPDGYVHFAQTGMPDSTPVSYVVLDQHIKQDRQLIERDFIVPLKDRDYTYYRRAERTLRALDRVNVLSPKEVEIVSAGARWHIVFKEPQRIYDHAEDALYPYVDLELESQTIVHVQLKVRGEKGPVYLYDDDNGMGEIMTLAHSRIEKLAGETGGAKRTQKKGMTPPRKIAITQAPDTSEREAETGIQRALAKETERETLGTLVLLINAKRDDGSVEKTFESTQGKVKVTFTYSGTGELTQAVVQSVSFIYPGGLLHTNWEQIIATKRKDVGMFEYENEELDLLKAKREVVEKSRELVAYDRVVEGLPADAPEQALIVGRRHALGDALEARYGRVLKEVDDGE